MLNLTLSNLKELDGGKGEIAFERHVRRAAADCTDRPGDSSARTVTMKVVMTPRMEPNGDCTDVNITFKFESTVPSHKTREYSMGVFRDGRVAFNPDSPDEINQKTYLPESEA